MGSGGQHESGQYPRTRTCEAGVMLKCLSYLRNRPTRRGGVARQILVTASPGGCYAKTRADQDQGTRWAGENNEGATEDHVVGYWQWKRRICVAESASCAGAADAARKWAAEDDVVNRNAPRKTITCHALRRLQRETTGLVRCVSPNRFTSSWSRPRSLQLLPLLARLRSQAGRPEHVRQQTVDR